MTGPTEAANAEERIARIETMVADLATIETKARKLAANVRQKAQHVAAERVARAEEIVTELEDVEQTAQQIATAVADKAAQIAAELTALKEATLRV